MHRLEHMFDGDLTGLSTADLLESAAEHRAEANRADARLLVHAQIYADRFHPDVCPVRPGRPGRRGGGGRERAVVLGGEGCPEIAEFAVAEFAVMLGVSPRVAADYLGNALALRHRFPFTWARVLAGDATPWKACRIVAECSKLSEEAARYVDQRVAGLVDSITPYRLDKIVKAAKFHADPDRARAEADEKSRERGVWLGRSDEHGTKSMFIKASSGAVTRHDATLAGIADALKTFGDTRPVQARRADAVGIIADPAFTQELLHQARDIASRPHRSARPPAPSSEDHRPGHHRRPRRTGPTAPHRLPNPCDCRWQPPATPGPGEPSGRPPHRGPAAVRATSRLHHRPRTPQRPHRGRRTPVPARPGTAAPPRATASNDGAAVADATRSMPHAPAADRAVARGSRLERRQTACSTCRIVRADRRPGSRAELCPNREPDPRSAR